MITKLPLYITTVAYIATLDKSLTIYVDEYADKFIDKYGEFIDWLLSVLYKLFAFIYKVINKEI